MTTSPSFASLNAAMLARKGEAEPSKEPRFGSSPWQPPIARPAGLPIPLPLDEGASAGASAKVRINDVNSIWPARKPARAPNPVDSAWIPTRTQATTQSHPVQAPGPAPVQAAARPRVAPIASIDTSSHPIKTTIRLTHAQARAVRLAALVLDKPQQEILSGRLLAQLEALACTDLSNCSCFKAVVAGLSGGEKPLTPPPTQPALDND